MIMLIILVRLCVFVFYYTNFRVLLQKIWEYFFRVICEGYFGNSMKNVGI